MIKEKSHLVTQDIVSAARWYLDSPMVVIKPEKGGDGKTTWKEKALIDLTNKLNRVKTPFPEAAKKGVDFENKVYEVAATEEKVGSENFQKVCGEVRGYTFYSKGKKTIDIDGMECFLYTKYDAIRYPMDHREPFIKDIKTTESYKRGKYLAGFQHKFYCYVSGIPNFSYVVVEWGEHPKIKNVHIESYICSDMAMLKIDVIHEIKECFSVLKDLGLWEAYRTKYCLY